MSAARAHPRWHLVGGATHTRTEASDVAARLGALNLEPRGTAPAPVSKIDTTTRTLLNDYGQHHIDSGLASLPGSWIHHHGDAAKCTE